MDKKPFFIYGAYQSVHTPLEAPIRYVEICSSLPYSDRKIFCAMMQALDEGINNITTLLEAKGLLDNTIIIFSTDNGGQTTQGSRNWPLRGNKATVFEGGIRGFAFVWGKTLQRANYDNTVLMHITNWYRTIVEGITGIQLSDNATKGLDGYNMWDVITQDEASPRTEILLQLNPPRYNTSPRPPFVGQAAIRVGDWKLITGQPNCSLSEGDKCPSGLVHLNGTIEAPPSDPSLIWLFNVTADPYERNNVRSTEFS